jgi:hypothetical protein
MFVEKVNNSHHRNWSGIYIKDTKQANVSATAISSRSDMKNSNQEDVQKKQSSIMFKNQNIRSQTKHSNYLRKLDSEGRLANKINESINIESSGNYSRRIDESINTLDINSSLQYSRPNLFTEEAKEYFMFSLPIDECFNLIHYEPKNSIDPLAQAVPSLTTKSKQTPKVPEINIKDPMKYKNTSSEKELLSHKIASYSSFNKKHSNQITRSKLSNYINSKVSKFGFKNIRILIINIRRKENLLK